MTNLKKYTLGEEVANTLMHLLGALFALYGTFVLEINSKNTLQSFATGIFGATLILLFLSSTCYHSTTNEAIKNIFQKIDHSAIYLLIAGTYTPALLLTVKFPLSLILLAIIWCLAITGVVFSSKPRKSKKLSTALYLIMGWMAVFFFYNVWAASHLSVWLMLAGGIFYSLGCIFYLMKFPYMHSLWHLFVIAGATTHYFAILVLLHSPKIIFFSTS